MTYAIIDSSTTKMEKVVDKLKDELVDIRTGMANPNMLAKVQVDYYGTPTPLNQISSISVQEGRTLVVKPYDPSSLKDIERACNEANLGIAPINDGAVIRLTVPQLTGEVRQQMAKKVGQVAEEAKIAIRNVRRDAMNVVKKDKTVDEDTQKDEENEVQKLTDRFIKTIDELAKNKEAEVLNKK